MQRFEKLFPLNADVYYDGERYQPYYKADDIESACVQANEQNCRYEGYQSRQPEIDEMVEALEDLMSLASEAMVLANRDGAEFDVDEELAIAYALVTKHKGKS